MAEYVAAIREKADEKADEDLDKLAWLGAYILTALCRKEVTWWQLRGKPNPDAPMKTKKDIDEEIQFLKEKFGGG